MSTDGHNVVFANKFTTMALNTRLRGAASLPSEVKNQQGTCLVVVVVQTYKQQQQQKTQQNFVKAVFERQKSHRQQFTRTKKAIFMRKLKLIRF